LRQRTVSIYLAKKPLPGPRMIGCQDNHRHVYIQQKAGKDRVNREMADPRLPPPGSAHSDRYTPSTRPPPASCVTCHNSHALKWDSPGPGGHAHPGRHSPSTRLFRRPTTTLTSNLSKNRHCTPKDPLSTITLHFITSNLQDDA
jgi:hypothetical protein